MTIVELISLAIVVFAAIFLVIFVFLHRRSAFSFRKISGFMRVQRAIGLVVEDGTRLHVSLGRGSLLTPFGAAAFASLSLLRRLGEVTSLSDRPPVATTGNAFLNIVSQETLRAAHESVAGDIPFESTNSRLAGLTPFSYVAGVIPSLRDEQVSSAVVMGDIGVEIGLLTEAAERQGAALVAASSQLPAQAVLYAVSPSPLIGEELFAAGAYTQAGSFHAASLRVQDVLRWLVILSIVAGAVLKFLGLL